MYKEPKPMRQIHRIQEKIYKDYKNLSAKEKLARIQKEAKQAEKKLGLNFSISSHSRAT